MFARNPSSPSRSQRAFTIVELLVTVAIIAVLMGLLIGGLRGAMGSARKTRELNGLRGVHSAWYQYSTSFEEHLLPGFLDTVTQENWQVTTPNLSGQVLPRAMSQTYTWRLAPFVDNPYSTFVGYMEIEGADTSANAAIAVPWDGAEGVPAWAESIRDQPGSLVALQPGFGYNAYYVGGWYEQGNPPRFSAGGSRVAIRLGAITRTTEQVIFAASTYRDPGRYPVRGGADDQVPGAAWIAPPQLGTVAVWQPLAMQDTGILQVGIAQAVPARRHNGQVATIRADGSTENSSVATLLDMRLWTSAADRADYSHGDN